MAGGWYDDGYGNDDSFLWGANSTSDTGTPEDVTPVETAPVDTTGNPGDLFGPPSGPNSESNPNGPGDASNLFGDPTITQQNNSSVVGTLDNDGIPILTDGNGNVVPVNNQGVISNNGATPIDPDGLGPGQIFDPTTQGGPTGTSGGTQFPGVLPLPVDPATAAALSVILSNGNIFGGGGSGPGLGGIASNVGSAITDPGQMISNVGDSISNIMGPQPAAGQGAGGIVLPGISWPTPDPGTTPVQAPVDNNPPAENNPSENNPQENPPVVAPANLGPTPDQIAAAQAAINQNQQNVLNTANANPNANAGNTDPGAGSGSGSGTTVLPGGGLGTGAPAGGTTTTTTTDNTDDSHTTGGTDIFPGPPTTTPAPATNTPAGGGTTLTGGGTPADNNPPGGTTVVPGGGTGGGGTPPGGGVIVVPPIIPTNTTMPTTTPPDPRSYYNEGNTSSNALQQLLSQISGLYGGASSNYSNTDYSNYNNIANQLGGSNGTLTGDANAQTAAANTALRTGNLNDVSSLSAQALGLRNQANSGLYGTSDGQGGYTGGSLNNYANGASNNLAFAQGIQANAGYLSPEDVRNSQQAAREAWSARGLVNAPGAVGAEILNQSNLTQQRQQQAFTNTNTALGAMQPAVQAQQSSAFDPFSTILGSQYGQQTNNAGSNQALFGNAAGMSSGAYGNQFVENAYNPYNTYSQDVNNTNFNAANAQYISGQNNAAALQGANTQANAQLLNGFLSNLAGLYGSGALGSCWVAREVYGADSPQWTDFRYWLFFRGPAWLRALYLKHGEQFAAWLKGHTWLKPAIRACMDRCIATLNPITQGGY